MNKDGLVGKYMSDKPAFPWHWVVLAMLVSASLALLNLSVALDARVDELITSGEQTDVSVAWSIAIQEVISKVVTALLPTLFVGGIVVAYVRWLARRINLI